MITSQTGSKKRTQKCRSIEGMIQGYHLVQPPLNAESYSEPEQVAQGLSSWDQSISKGRDSRTSQGDCTVCSSRISFSTSMS